MCSMCKAARSELRQGGPCVQCVLCVRLLGRCCAREAHVIHVAAETVTARAEHARGPEAARFV